MFVSTGQNLLMATVLALNVASTLGVLIPHSDAVDARHPDRSRENALKALRNAAYLPHLPSGWHVDEAIKSEEDRVVVIRFGHDWDPECITMDESLYGATEKVQNIAVIYVVDITEVPDFNKMYELYDPCTVMFFYRNKHIMIDLGTGNNNKINWAMDNKQEVIDIIETVYRGASQGRGLVVSPKDYSTH
ncbi:mitosis protein DIM1-domain-containing protein [Mycena rebaudengoi]|nr:mitosis protein DIM1-domain-containing protein [Mycena rebaudengoi]